MKHGRDSFKEQGEKLFSMFSVIGLLLLSSALYKDVSAGDCITVSGAAAGKACVFPFKARGVEYTTCTKAGGFATAWCSTKVDSSGNTVIGNWGDCPTDDPTNCFPEENNENQDNTDTDTGECLTISGAQKGVKCVFPFKARGTLYYQCTTAGGFTGTTPRGECLTISGAQRGKPCVFPFKA